MFGNRSQTVCYQTVIAHGDEVRCLYLWVFNGATQRIEKIRHPRMVLNNLQNLLIHLHVRLLPLIPWPFREAWLWILH